MATFFPHGTRSPRKTPADPLELYAVTVGMVIANARRKAAAFACSTTELSLLFEELPPKERATIERSIQDTVAKLSELSMQLHATAENLERDKAYYLALEDDTGKNAMCVFIANTAAYYSDKAETNPEFDYLHG